MINLEAWIKSYEGLNLHTYVDTNGHVTVGWGRNLEKGISISEAQLMFENDLQECFLELQKYNWWNIQPIEVKQALVNMCFNLGITKLLEFKDMIAALEAKDYTKAAQAALDSTWAKQVHQRANDIALVIREGK